jgi:hypothetical protein
MNNLGLIRIGIHSDLNRSGLSPRPRAGLIRRLCEEGDKPGEHVIEDMLRYAFELATMMRGQIYLAPSCRSSCSRRLASTTCAGP